ncbi:type VI secretion system baseplate subunit TssG [Oxalobacteraceae bacterium]|nr:type VI secretion system baseplate subunit TssG [Oxalobacteraceae bacterium]
MPTPERTTGTDLIDMLTSTPHRFEFFQAVRLLELAMRQSRNGEDADGMADARLAQPIQFHNRLSLAFPPSQIDDVTLKAGTDGDPGQATGLHITPAFLGLLGSTGTLPLHYSERIAAHERSTGDAGPRAFLDMLSHRAQSLFYQAWARHRPECMVTAGGDDAFLAMLTALSGSPALQDPPEASESALDPETLAFYAAQFRCRTTSAGALASVLAEYFGVPLTIEQLVGVWEQLPTEHQAQLGVVNSDLDAGMLLGDAIYTCDSRARIRIGPLDQASFDSFLPGASAAVSLAALLRMHCGAGMTYEVRLVLRADDVHDFRLAGAGDPGGSRLGIDCYLSGQAIARDRDDFSYLLPM